jgi:Bacterial capsule synthesis protein PGA_cap
MRGSRVTVKVWRAGGVLLPCVLLPCVLLAACGTSAAAPHHGARQRSAPAHTGARPAGAHPQDSSITLAFAGDVHFTGRTTRLLRDPASAFGPIARLLRSADLTVVNLETAVTSRGRPQPKTYHFRTRPAAFTALRDAGIDIANMANNHVLDYGRTGLADTITAARRANFPVLGIGRDAAAAWAPYIVTVKGVRIAFIGVSDVAELAPSWVATGRRSGEANAINLPRTLAAVRAARKMADVVVVIMHWGTEGEACPDANQLALAPKLAAAGASIIVGSHAHMLQGSGWLRHTFVAYGMANFLWWETSFSVATGVLLLTLHRHAPLTYRFVPATVSATGQPVVDAGLAARQARAHYRSLRACARLSARPGR